MKDFTFVIISSVEDYQNSTAFINKLPNHIKKVLVVTVENGVTERVECQDPFIQVYKFGYTDFSFSTARNFAKNLATTEWIISIDMDEEFHYSNDDLERIKEAPKEIGGFYNTILNFDENGALLKAHKGCRIFRKRFFWKYCVHEDITDSILTDSGIAETPIIFRHFGYDNIDSDKYYSKLERNYKLCIKDCAKYPDDDYVRSNMNRITNDMRRWNDNKN